VDSRSPGEILVAGTTAASDELLSLAARMRGEYERRAVAGEDATDMETVIAEIGAIALEIGDVAHVDAVRRVIERHGPGLCFIDVLAVLAGVNPDGLTRILADLDAAGLGHLDAQPRGRSRRCRWCRNPSTSDATQHAQRCQNWPTNGVASRRQSHGTARR